MSMNTIFGLFGMPSIILDESPDIMDVEYEDITEEVNNRNKKLTGDKDANQNQICEMPQ